MNIRRIPVVTTEAVLYLLAAILAFLCLGLAASVAGLPLVPLVLPAIVALVLLARHLAHRHPMTKV
ncbi:MULTISPECIES: hypothetical protein [Streptomyces]|uniref:Uncharacterized protein n=1 Tax=Streptomyces gilvifuscus TaxID=1550617 RepID=A0ABT5FQB1_9ACTN|nr:MULTISPECIES: hypothetical protein [Streptomyces]MBK3641479.1 hypothetical protein [Streptomyces sp. MBT33]MDC2954714.1 hypothetical protein [Streptomyces gilvifuscus]